MTWQMGIQLTQLVYAHQRAKHQVRGVATDLRRQKLFERLERQPVAGGRLGARNCRLRDTPLPWPRGQAAERRSDMVRHGEFDNLPSFRADR
jgi:hypothetical protein